MSSAAVLKQSPNYFNRTESISVFQTSLPDVLKAKASDELQVLLPVIFHHPRHHHLFCSEKHVHETNQ